jgi:hypothetical protein
MTVKVIAAGPLPPILECCIARFAHGALVATPGALRVLDQFRIEPLSLIARHISGDFGELDEYDLRANEEAVACGFRVFSAYTLNLDDGSKPEFVRIWCITEADRSITTLLRPEDH